MSPPGCFRKITHIPPEQRPEHNGWGLFACFNTLTHHLFRADVSLRTKCIEYKVMLKDSSGASSVLPPLPSSPVLLCGRAPSPVSSDKQNNTAGCPQCSWLISGSLTLAFTLFNYLLSTCCIEGLF